MSDPSRKTTHTFSATPGNSSWRQIAASTAHNIGKLAQAVQDVANAIRESRGQSR